MVLGDISRTRRLAGNPASSNVSDADISQGLLYGTAYAIGLTGKADWETDTTNPMYPAVVMAVEYFADSMVRDRFMDQTDVSTEHYDRAVSILTQVVESLASTGTGGVGGGGGTGLAIATRPYRTYPLNPSAPIYRSLISPGQELVGTEQLYTSNANQPQ